MITTKSVFVNPSTHSGRTKGRSLLRIDPERSRMGQNLLTRIKATISLTLPIEDSKMELVRAKARGTFKGGILKRPQFIRAIKGRDFRPRSINLIWQNR